MVSWDELQPERRAGLDPSYMAHLQATLTYCARHYMLVIVCVSQHMFSKYCRLASSDHVCVAVHGAPLWSLPRKHVVHPDRQDALHPSMPRAYVYDEECQLLWHDFRERWLRHSHTYLDLVAQLTLAIQNHPSVLGIQPLVDPWLCSKTLGQFYAQCLDLACVQPGLLWFFAPAAHTTLASTRDAMLCRVRSACAPDRVVWCINRQSSDFFMYALEYSLQAFDWVFALPSDHIMFIGTATGAVQQAHRASMMGALFPWAWDVAATRTMACPVAQRQEIRYRLAHLRTRLLLHGVASTLLGLAWLSGGAAHLVPLNQWEYGFISVYVMHGTYCISNAFTTPIDHDWSATCALGCVSWGGLLLLLAWQGYARMFMVALVLCLQYIVWSYGVYGILGDITRCRYYLGDVAPDSVP